MIDDNNIQVADLCVLQFREPLEYEMYPEQVDMYCPKIWNQELKVQVLTNQTIDTADNLYLVIYNDKGYKLGSKKFAIDLVSTGIYQANATFSKNDIAAITENSTVYFSIEKNDASVVYATSVWYIINPAYTDDLKQITYAHGTNDWNVQFSTSEFTITVEAGFKPTDSRDEQDTEDFVEQNMVNETIFGDEYEVIGLTFGDKTGIPNWLRKKISRASLCDTFKVDGVEYSRIQGAKVEKIDDTYHGLATYKLDIQTIKNYLQ